MTPRNARICIAPNCHRVAAATEAGTIQLCQPCFFAHRSMSYQQLPPNPINVPCLPPMIPQLPQQALYQNIFAPPPNQFIPTPPTHHFFRPVDERREILRREEERREQVEQDKLNSEKLLDVTEDTDPPPSCILQLEPPAPRPYMISLPPRLNVPPPIPNFGPRGFASLSETVPHIPNLIITPIAYNLTHLGTPEVVSTVPTAVSPSLPPVSDNPPDIATPQLLLFPHGIILLFQIPPPLLPAHVEK